MAVSIDRRCHQASTDPLAPWLGGRVTRGSLLREPEQDKTVVIIPFIKKSEPVLEPGLLNHQFELAHLTVVLKRFFHSGKSLEH